jgi:gliding motility-associated-like protein
MKILSGILMIVLMFLNQTIIKAQADDTVCAFNTQKLYRVTGMPGSKFYWSVECGKIVSKNIHADSILVQWCTTPGTYEIKVVECNSTGCWGDTVRSWVTISGKMDLLIEGNDGICEGDVVSLRARGAKRYLWSTGETSDRIFVKPTDSIKYNVIGYNDCGSDTAWFKVKVYQKPKANFTYNPKNPMVDESIFFHYTGFGASHWTWYFGDKNALGGRVTDPHVSFSEKGDKIITLVAENDAGCTDTMSYRLHVTAFSKIFVPNSFTPNADGKNDVFRAIGFNLQSIHMQIYNRWGEMIYESSDMEQAWDGTFKGQKVQEGVYLYMIQASGNDGEQYYLNGNVTLLY